MMMMMKKVKKQYLLFKDKKGSGRTLGSVGERGRKFD